MSVPLISFHVKAASLKFRSNATSRPLMFKLRSICALCDSCRDFAADYADDTDELRRVVLEVDGG